MLIVVEGVDCGGKSGVIAKLMDLYQEWCAELEQPSSFTVLHHGPPEPGTEPFTEYELPLQTEPDRNRVRSLTELVLVDRLHVGETIYGPLYRGSSRLTAGGVLHVEMLLDALGAVKLLAQPADVNLVLKRYADRGGDDVLKPEHVARVHAAYEAHAAWFGWRRVGAFNGGQRVDENLLTQAHGRVLGTYWTTRFPSLIGDPTRTDTVLVGDRRGDGPNARLEFPAAFTPWAPNGSAEYLMTALDKLGRRPNRHEVISIVNINEPGTHSLHDSFIHLNEVLKGPRYVALGQNAAAALDELKLGHVTVPHPSYWKRFRHREHDQYTDVLGAAIRGRGDYL